MWHLLLITLTLILFFLPLLPALQEWRLKEDIMPLRILQTHTGDIRYFSGVFNDFIQNKISALTGHFIRGQYKALHCYFIEQGESFVPNRKESQYQKVRRMIVAFGALCLPNHFTFSRELYAKQALTGGINNHFLAVFSEGLFSIGRGSTLSLFAHAHTISAERDCHLTGRVSATEEIALAEDCTFMRLNAPCVKFGTGLFQSAAKSVQESAPFPNLRSDSHPDNRLVSGVDMEIPEYGIVWGDIDHFVDWVK